MEVIVVANQKGGIGKTTTATNIATILLDKKKKTLLIDADPQGNSTDTFRAVSKDVATLYDVILDLDDPLPINEAIQKTEIGDIIASDPALKKADTVLANDPGALFRLKEALETLNGYDYVIIDTAPADNLLLKNCLAAANKVVVPVTPDRYAIQGLSDLNKTLMGVKKYQNPNLKIEGLLIVKYRVRERLSRDISDTLDAIAEKMQTKVFEAKIRDSVKVRNAQATMTTLAKYEPTSDIALDYKAFVEELIKTK